MKAKITLIVAALLGACAATGGQESAAGDPRASAVASIQPTQGNTARGRVRFTELAGSKVRVEADVTGLKPGLHGFHIHEKGDCSAPDAASAGGHFNPRDKPHGGSAGSERHAGDLGNLNADNTGHASLTVEVEDISLSDAASNVLNRAVVVHANPDDTTGQPAGNSGGRIGCGVIEKG